MISKYLYFLTFVALLYSCNGKSQPIEKGYVLNSSERAICDTLQIDSSIVKDIREFNTRRIEAFHYSRGKTYSDGKEFETAPTYLNGLVFSESNNKSYDVIISLKDKFKTKGYSIFLLENNFGLNNKLDNIGVLKTVDKFTILKQIETDGINYEIDNDSLISIIKVFDNKYSLELIGASGDWCEFIINKEPASWTEFAKEVYKVCPDVVDQGTETVQALADEMKRTRRLYFWWD